MVEAALRLLGSLKAVMPFEMASTPVRAVQPLLNARKTSNNPKVMALCCKAANSSAGYSMRGRLPVA